jgi:Zn finger protein HypA/HybF involved in hydrogenase expression
MSESPLGCRQCPWTGGYDEYAQTTEGRAVCPQCKGGLLLAQYRPR